MDNFLMGTSPVRTLPHMPSVYFIH